MPDPAANPIQEHAFPILTAAQIARMRSFGTVRRAQAGDILFQPGDLARPLFVLLSGALEVVQPTDHGEVPVISHAPGEFTGEMNMITGRPSLVRGRVTASGELLEIPNEKLRALITGDAELSELLMRAFILRRIALIARGQGDVVLLGSRHSAGTTRIREFLSRNGHPYNYLDLDRDDSAQQMLDRFHVSIRDIPIVVCHGQSVLRNPSNQQLADCLGFNEAIDERHLRDVVVIGAGPAGLSAAVYAASEGLDVLAIECNAPGGQAGSSSRIENYLGFPMGISGNELAGRAYTQAQKFGADILIARSVAAITCDRRPYRLQLDDGANILARTIVIASGARYNGLTLSNIAQFENAGVYYGATYIEAQLCGGEEVIVVGGGNSAGQAAIFLAQTADKVHMLVRSGALADSMSRYLIDRIEHNPKIDLHFDTELDSLDGDDRLRSVAWRNNISGAVNHRPIAYVFLMTGATPNTQWLKSCVAEDPGGFIKTGRDLSPADLAAASWPLSRTPLLLETSLPGIFAVGDVRANNVKRVASAVGEGSISIALIHQILQE